MMEQIHNPDDDENSSEDSYVNPPGHWTHPTALKRLKHARHACRKHQEHWKIHGKTPYNWNPNPCVFYFENINKIVVFGSWNTSEISVYDVNEDKWIEYKDKYNYPKFRYPSPFEIANHSIVAIPVIQHDPKKLKFKLKSKQQQQSKLFGNIQEYSHVLSIDGFSSPRQNKVLQHFCIFDCFSDKNWENLAIQANFYIPTPTWNNYHKLKGKEPSLHGEGARSIYDYRTNMVYVIGGASTLGKHCHCLPVDTPPIT